jgi:hypothetical protein
MAKAKRKGVKPRFSRHDLQVAERMIAEGCTKAQLCRALHCAPSTATRHFGDQLRHRKRGRVARVWTQEERDLVGLAAGLGQAQSAIAKMLRMALAQFQRVFAEELVTAKARLDAKITAAIVNRALGPTGDGADGDPVLLRFYARARVEGWNDRRVAEPLPTGEPAEEALRKTIDQLDDAGLAAARVVLEQLGASSPLSQTGPGPDDPIN